MCILTRGMGFDFTTVSDAAKVFGESLTVGKNFGPFFV
jgi:hypothetical protein